MSNPSKALTTVGPLKQALALATEAGDLSKLNNIQATASAMQEGARALGMGLDAENEAAEVTIRAQRALGMTLAHMLETGQRRASGKQTGRGQGKEVAGLPPTLDQVLAEHRIQASPPTLQAWRLLAAIPDEEFEQRFATVKAASERQLRTMARVDFLRLVRGAQDAQKAALTEVRNAMSADDATPAFRAFEKALMTFDPATAPEDELAKAGALIATWVASYNARRARVAA